MVARGLGKGLPDCRGRFLDSPEISKLSMTGYAEFVCVKERAERGFYVMVIEKKGGDRSRKSSGDGA